MCVINNLPKYKSGKVNETDILVTKWKLLSKRKTTMGQSNPRNPLTE